ncbi:MULTISPECIES: glutamate ABC transporter substrate-binding protein [unclassified Solwaraspora]|uniref:glutamate ABC transporter substrate-binding protein n=1 Tax=unclassified Solwaraspora TaxID=2627926 RepID=UPI00259BC98F|nr:glutamate ABC transporter substrate-binding protein [Solwaraspora sp. WMMA2056]WJK39870.1 glutamate ABC transporter substrate-binding protein [Solwaraspora sp. WMMA2056]
MRMSRVAAVAAAAALALSVAACGDNSDGTGSENPDVATPTFEAGTTMARLSEAGKITVGTKFDQPGFGLLGLDGKPAGFDVEIAKLIAAELGIEADDIEYVEAPSAVREEVIEQGRVDIVVATYTINDARKERIDFAGPYYVAGQHIMVGADDDSITGPESFEAGDKKVCSVQGSTPAENIQEYLANAGEQLVLFDVYDKCVEALRGGQVDAVTTDNVILLGFIAENEGEFKLAGEQFTEEPYGIGVAKGDDAFRDFINDTLEKIYEDGSYAQAWESTAGAFDDNTPTGPAVDRY